MKKINMVTTAAVATVMTASSAHADLSLGGAIASVVTSGDSISGVSHYGTSYTINIDYTTTLDNGMGLAVNTDIAPSLTDGSEVLYLMTFSSDMGSFYTGTDFSSAVDDMDGAPGAGTYSGGGRILTSGTAFNDGDAASGNGFGVSTSVAGVSLKATMGAGANRAMSIAGSMNIAGATVKAGNTDFDTSGSPDHSFATVGYSVGGFSLGWGHWDSDATSMTQIGASTTVAGLGVGVSSASADNGSAADTDATGIHVSGDLGDAFWIVDYINTDNGDGTENDQFKLTFGTGF
ncbi:hypothetical protein N8753_01155 [Pelagibacteraceae bacterium]|nr:hypothetical protein [Pelagibacteraceae bacterium]